MDSEDKIVECLFTAAAFANDGYINGAIQALAPLIEMKEERGLLMYALIKMDTAETIEQETTILCEYCDSRRKSNFLLRKYFYGYNFKHPGLLSGYENRFNIERLIYLETENQRLHRRIIELQARLTEARYRPSGKGMKRAERHFKCMIPEVFH